MIDSSALLTDLKSQVKILQADLKESAEDPTNSWGLRLKEAYVEALGRERTGWSWAVWRDNEVEQAAVAWIVSLTFLRFCEDNDLLAGAKIDGLPTAIGWIAGPDDRIQRAEENLTAYFRENPTHNRRHWLQQGLGVLAAQPAGTALVDPKHNHVWTAEISPESATALIAFWRRTNNHHKLVHDFTDAGLGTRFLGDLYQDLSKHAKKTYALLQTPIFVEEFILERTLSPAIAEFGLEGLRIIDPSCGSGHFLLGAFDRLNQGWLDSAPGLDAKERVRRAMASIHGVDVNPFAVAIARFRLTVASLKAAGEGSLVGLPEIGFRLAIGDSLLGEQGGVPAGLDFEGEATTFNYDTEDLAEYVGILQPGRYHVVVGNPPYIAPKDRALRAMYRQAYVSAHGQYALSAPFMELMFRLAVKGEQGNGAGYVGQITANAFMKREFGRKLIEHIFAGHDLSNPVDLTAVIDTAGAHIPGHGTPTVIIFGRRRRPVGELVRAVLGFRGEPGQPVNPSKGLVWTEIAEHIDESGYEGFYVTVTDLDRETLNSHPWSLGGGGLNELKALVEENEGRLGSQVRRMGMFGDSHAEEYFAAPIGTFTRLGVAEKDVAGAIDGNAIRDWAADTIGELFFAGGMSECTNADQKSRQALWRWRSSLWARATFSGATYRSARVDWLSWHQVSARRTQHVRLVFAKISTHFHAARSEAIDIEKPGALRIELAEGATVDEHLALLGVLNSSTACFWLKQVCQNKGNGGIGGGIGDEAWEPRYEFTGTKLEQLPLPSTMPLERARALDLLSTALSASAPTAVVSAWIREPKDDLGVLLSSAEADWHSIRMRLIFEQEELDWAVYGLYGILDDNLNYTGSTLPEFALGERAFEIALARHAAAGTEETAWFERHGSTPTTDLPSSWPNDYTLLVQKRLDCIGSDSNIRLLEKAEFKRRWSTPTWEVLRAGALRAAILDRLEEPALWRDSQGPVMRSVAELADLLRADSVLRALVQALTENAEPDLASVIGGLVPEEMVPFVAAYRLKPPGLEKYRAWQSLWDLQRREDLGKDASIVLPANYVKADFVEGSFWKARGKFDVPKERFISYPGVGRGVDASPVLGWAGWSHRDQALALARELPGQQDAALVPLIAGLVELEPWLTQWHSEIEPAFAASPAAVIAGVVDQYLARMETTRDQVTAWTPPAATRGRKASR